MDKAKSFSISKRAVWEAYKRVKANDGAAGVDGQTIEDFEQDVGNSRVPSFRRFLAAFGLPRMSINPWFGESI